MRDSVAICVPGASAREQAEREEAARAQLACDEALAAAEEAVALARKTEAAELEDGESGAGSGNTDEESDEVGEWVPGEDGGEADSEVGPGTSTARSSMASKRGAEDELEDDEALSRQGKRARTGTVTQSPGATPKAGVRATAGGAKGSSLVVHVVSLTPLLFFFCLTSTFAQGEEAVHALPGDQAGLRICQLVDAVRTVRL